MKNKKNYYIIFCLLHCQKQPKTKLPKWDEKLISHNDNVNVVTVSFETDFTKNRTKHGQLFAAHLTKCFGFNHMYLTAW